MKLKVCLKRQYNINFNAIKVNIILKYYIKII